MERWYTLYTKPNVEYQVADSLKQRGLETYLPETESANPRAGRERKPVFPCYLFLRIDVEATGLIGVQWTPGLRWVVTFDERPTPVPDEAIQAIRRRVDGINAAGGWPAHGFRPGDAVRVADGPLHGLVGIFERPTTPSQRVQVLLTFLGQVSRAWLAAADLERAPAGAEIPQPRPPRRTRGRGRRISGAEEAGRPAREL
jgi:transcriptional antiterminator RfaH